MSKWSLSQEEQFEECVRDIGWSRWSHTDFVITGKSVRQIGIYAANMKSRNPTKYNALTAMSPTAAVVLKAREHSLVGSVGNGAFIVDLINASDRFANQKLSFGAYACQNQAIAVADTVKAVLEKTLKLGVSWNEESSVSKEQIESAVIEARAAAEAAGIEYGERNSDEAAKAQAGLNLDGVDIYGKKHDKRYLFATCDGRDCLFRHNMKVKRFLPRPNVHGKKLEY